jgi:hypothetical protein
MALEPEAGFQFVGHQLEIRRPLEGEKLLEKGDDFGRPVGPMVATGKLGGEAGTFSEKSGAEPINMGAADLELEGGISEVDEPLIKLLKDLLEKQVGEAFGELLFS